MSDPIGDALRADAEAARDEIRAAGISCPSCGKNLGDLYGKGHRYEGTVIEDGIPLIPFSRDGTVKCTEGTAVPCDGMTYEQAQAAAQIALMDEFWRREGEEFDRTVIGTRGGSGFAGLLGLLP